VDYAQWPPTYDPDFLPTEDDGAWFPELEFGDPQIRNQLILAKLQSQIRYAWTHSALYRRKWEDAGLTPDSLQSLDDLARFPLTTKDDLRATQEANPPFGDHLCIRPEQVHRLHGTSGTTGRPTTFGIGRGDWRRIGEAHARAMWGAGIRPSDRVMIASFFSLYIGSWGALVGAERLGSTVFPFGAGVEGQTLQAAKWAPVVEPTAFYSTPSYALHFAEVARSEGLDPRSVGIRTLFFSGEPGAGVPSTKQRIEGDFGGAAIDMGTMAEMTPWMSSAECAQRTGMHLYQDIVFAQVCDPETGLPVPPGAEGMPVYTHLERTSQPMIRYASGDRTHWTDEPCPCGRTYPRLPSGLYGRYDDMLVVRGVNVYPSAVEDALRAFEGFGGEFRIVVSRRGVADQLVVQVEHDAVASGGPTDDVRDRVTTQIRNRAGVTPVVELLPTGALDRTAFKARRVIDDRNLFEELSRGAE
jgi:phenylacetate-CoA ligase